MATPSEAVRTQLAVVTAAAVADLTAETAQVALERQAAVLLASLPLVVPSYYDAAGALAVMWYDELREESRPSTLYVPEIVGDPATDWIEREAETFRRSLEGVDFEAQMASMVDEITRLAEKEVARGFRDSITGNTRQDREAIGWSRVTRPGACKFCLMLAGKGSVYRSESTAIFAAHGNCHCAARPEFRNGEHGPEATAIQYVASSRRARDDRTQAARNAQVRKYLNANFPDARG